VTLTWNPSTSVVSGYHIYRGTTSGGPYSLLNSILDPGTSFVDSNVAKGSEYFYVTTAVDSFGVESVFSNEASATIPNQ
jgi:fibronectin type 3 domain-containing protein